MSNYRGNMLFGFAACIPAEKLSKLLYYHLFCPAVGANPATGEAGLAPLGLRRIESSLIDEFGSDQVTTAHCDYLEKAIGSETKIVGINAMDPLGISPLTSMGRPFTPYTHFSFKILMKKIKKLKQEYRFKTVLGGGGAWQLAGNKQARELYEIDHVVLGEADQHCTTMFYDVMNNEAPEVMSVMTNKITDIPLIKGPTTSSAIEAMRGCGKGCDFCDPNKRMKRDFPIERLKEEAKINLDYGHRSIWLMSDEIMLYGCDSRNLYPNRDAIIELFSAMKSLGKVDYVGAVHLSLSSAVADPQCIMKIKEINNFGPGRWNSVQTGLETGSVRLFKKHLGYKAKPYSAEEWPDVVVQGTKVLNKGYFIALHTVIIGLPGETDDDVQDTINLVKALDGTESFITPTLWTDYYNPEKSLTIAKFNKLQWKLFYLCWKKDLESIDKWIWQGTGKFPPYLRHLAVMFTKIGVRHQLRLIRDEAKKVLGQDPDFEN